MKKLLIASLFAAVSTSAFVVDAAQVEKFIPLKDGATVYIFKDGKMGMEGSTAGLFACRKATSWKPRAGRRS